MQDRQPARIALVADLTSASSRSDCAEIVHAAKRLVNSTPIMACGLPTRISGARRFCRPADWSENSCLPQLPAGGVPPVNFPHPALRGMLTECLVVPSPYQPAPTAAVNGCACACGWSCKFHAIRCCRDPRLAPVPAVDTLARDYNRRPLMLTSPRLTPSAVCDRTGWARSPSGWFFS